MKKYALFMLLLVQLTLSTKTIAQNIAINATGSLPDTSAMLDISSTNKGFLAPRMTTTQQNTIPLPANGLLIFNTTDNIFKVNTGSNIAPIWWPLTMGSGTAINSLNGLTGTTQTFATGTTGTDFGISSSGTAHTFNLPTASATNRGALSSTDWNTFNGKQSALGFTPYNSTNPSGYISSSSIATATDATITSPANNQVLQYNSVSGKWINTTPGYLSSYAETDPIVKAINGIVKSNGTTISAAVAGTDYVIPSGSITGNAATVTTNANLTGPITSTGNATSIAAQTGTGTTFVMSASPTLTGTPTLPTGTIATTQTAGNNSTAIATTAFVTAAVSGTTASWSMTGNSVTAGSNFLGSTNNVSLRIRTSNAERMVIDSVGNVGIGIASQTSKLAVKDSMEVRRTGTKPAQLLFTNTAGSGDFRIGGDGGDIYWQGGGGRSLQMGSYWPTILGGDRQTATFPSFVTGIGGTSVIIASQRDASVTLGVQPNSATQTGNLTEWRNSSGTAISVVNPSGNLGLGVINPAAYLHLKSGTAIAGSAPLKLTSGINLTTPEDGAVEYNGTHFYATIGATRYQLDQQNAGGTTTVANGGTGQSSSLNAGGVMYGSSATAMAATAAGISGQVLQSAGAAAPVWVNGGSMMLSGNSNNIAISTVNTSTNNYFPMAGSISAVSTTDVQGGTRSLVSRAGTIRNLYVIFDTKLLGNKNLTITVYKNGVIQTLAVLLNTTSGTTGSDTIDSFTVAAGDEVGIVISSTSTPNNSVKVSWSADFNY
jgi:hypothetical protein